MVDKIDIDHHQKHDCLQREIVCEECGDSTTYNSLHISKTHSCSKSLGKMFKELKEQNLENGRLMANMIDEIR